MRLPVWFDGILGPVVEHCQLRCATANGNSPQGGPYLVRKNSLDESAGLKQVMLQTSASGHQTQHVSEASLYSNAPPNSILIDL